MVTFENTQADSGLRYEYEAQRRKQSEKWYFAIRAFMRESDDIAASRKWFDAYIAEYGNGKYAAWLEEALKQIVGYANDKAGYNTDGTPKQRIVMGGKEYTVALSTKFYGDDRVKLIAERSVTYTDTAAGKSWHWQVIAWVERKSEDDVTGWIYRWAYLNGAVFDDNSFRFNRVMNPLYMIFSDPMQTVDSFLCHVELLTKQMNQ